MFEDGSEVEPRSVGVVRVITLFCSAVIALLMVFGLMGYVH